MSLHEPWVEQTLIKSVSGELGSDAKRYLLFWSAPSKVNIARVLHLLEHAQICAGVSYLLHHGGADARKEDALRGMDPQRRVRHAILHVSELHRSCMRWATCPS